MNLNKIFKKERKIVCLVMIVYFLGVMVGVANAETMYTVYIKNSSDKGTVFKSNKICWVDHGIYVGKNVECGFGITGWEAFIPYQAISYISKDTETIEELNPLRPVSPSN